MRHLSMVEIMTIDERLDAIECALSEFKSITGDVTNRGPHGPHGPHVRGMDAIHKIRTIIKCHKGGRSRRGIINLEVEARKKSQAKFQKILDTNKRKSVSRYKPQRQYYTTGPI